MTSVPIKQKKIFFNLISQIFFGCIRDRTQVAKTILYSKQESPEI